MGIALNARRIQSDYRTYVLMGDGETAEGSVWEAADVAVDYALDNLCAITDVNRLGQSQATRWQHDVEALQARWEAAGWQTLPIDGHDMKAILTALDSARRTRERPTMILARTKKGKGVRALEDREGWHGKALKAGSESDDAIAELERTVVPSKDAVSFSRKPIRRSAAADRPTAAMSEPEYDPGELVATREAFGTALARLGAADPRVVALDADVKNSTFSDRFEKAFPDRFYEMFIAEQAMLGVAMGLAARGAVPFPSTFGCFLTRAADFIRVAGISRSNIKVAGTHVGVSIGEDGPSQMALEDIAMMRAVPGCTVLCPADAVSTERLVALAGTMHGPVYLRLSRPKTPILYRLSDQFRIGGSKTLRASDTDAVTIVAIGVTLFEALKAYDLLKAQSIDTRIVDAYSIKPIDREALTQAAAATGGRVLVVEDHYPEGGLGDAVCAALWNQDARVRRLAVSDVPRSGLPEELLDYFGISANAIAATVESWISADDLRRGTRQ